jgi:excinuclease UvrABC nuclease subunit
MVVKINHHKLLSLVDCQVDLLKLNQPGIYFLFNDKNKLIYIGESKFPLIRIMDHYFKHYPKERKFKKGFQKKGIGPVFSKFRILTLKKETDKRIKQHYEKRWIKRFNPELNFHSSQVPYNVSIKEIKTFIMIYEDFFSDRMTWFRYINDEVMKQRPDYKEHSKKLRRRRYEITGR